MTPTLAFLKHVLPEQGLKVAWVKPDGNKASWHIVTKSCEELAQRILQEDDYPDRTVYHACASFNERLIRGMRTHANALGAKAFWLDVDAGEGKPYADATEAAQRIADFVRRNDLPAPLYVGSGNGVHVYWPLQEMLGPELWRQYADGLKQLCHHDGLQADPARTADISSVLRTPGTHHRKSGVREVVCGPLAGPYAIQSFEHLRTTSPVRRSDARIDANRSALSARPAMLAAMSAVYEDSPRYADIVASKCAQVRALRDSGGNLTEPLWYASLGVLAFCDDGSQKAHEWSAGYEGYTKEETDDRLSRRKNLSGPTTCDYFSSLNPAPCATCIFRGKITTPLNAGDHKPPIQSPVVSATLFPPGEGSKIGGVELPRLPDNFGWTVSGQLVAKSETAEGQDSNTLISEHPIFLDTVQTGEADNGKFNYVFRQFLPQHGWLDIHVDAGDLNGPTGLSRLARRGAVIHDSKMFMSYVRHAADAYHQQRAPQMSYDQFGWKDNDTKFLCGRRLYAADSVVDAVGSQEVRLRSQWLVPAKGGSLEAWSGAANKLFTLGCEAQSVALLASFAAPLMRFHSTDEGGAILSLYSRESGTGKTTALAAAASVWGLEKGLALTNIDTRVSKAITLGVLGNMPVIYDELGNRDPEVLKEFVVVFTEGRDKMRATTEGEIRHTQSSWQTLLISGTNMSLVDILQMVGGSDAPAFRVIEMPISLPEGVNHSTGDLLKKTLQRNSGYAGDAYLQYLLQPDVLTWTRKALTQWTEELWRETKLQSQHRFWIRTMGSIATAAVLVERMGLLQFSPQRIISWMIDRLADQRGDAPVTGQVARSAVAALGEYINEHVADILVMPGAYVAGQRQMPLQRPMRQLLIRYERGNGRLLLAERSLREWMMRREISSRDVIRQLKEHLICTAERRLVTLGAGTDIPGGQVPCVELDANHPALSGLLRPIEEAKQA